MNPIIYAIAAPFAIVLIGGLIIIIHNALKIKRSGTLLKKEPTANANTSSTLHQPGDY